MTIAGHPRATGRRWAAGNLTDRIAGLGRHPWLADVATFALVATGSLLWVWQHGIGRGAGWAWTVGLVAPLPWARRAPVTVFAAVAGVALAQWAAGPPLFADTGLLVALFAVVSERGHRDGAAAWAVLEAGVVMASVRWHFSGSWVRSLVGLSGLAAAALLAGAVTRARRQHVVELTDRAVRLERERDQQSQIAVAAERTRIAREMHDVVAHNLAVMITMADAASAKLGHDPDRAREAVDHVAAVGRQALGEMRRLLGVLRVPEDAALTPQPGLAQLPELLAPVCATGLRAALTVEGDPWPMPAGAELAVYRIVQEALTNTLKHGVAATTAAVALRYHDEAVEVTVVDDGREGGGGRAIAAPGHGLAGMRERAALYRGQVHCGPGPDGGYQVRARLPRLPAAPPLSPPLLSGAQ